MKITKIEQQKNNKNRVNIYCDEKFTFGLTQNGIIDFGLYVGKELTQETIEDITKQDSFNRGLTYAYDYLSYGLRTEKDMRTKLAKKEIEEKYIDDIINKLKEYNYINDKYYVETYIKSKAIPSNYGKQKVINALYIKGINKELVIQVWEELGDNIDIETQVKELIEKKLNILKKEPFIKKKEKISRFLLSKGYQWNDFSDILNTLVKNDV